MKTRAGGAGERGEDGSLIGCDKLLLATSGFIGEGHADETGLHERFQISPDSVLARVNVQMLNDFGTCARGVAKGE